MTTHSVLATIVYVALGAASAAAQTPGSSCAQVDAIGKPESRVCPLTDQDAVRIPDSIQVPEDLRPRMHVMLQKSATFRSQCRRIAEAPQLYARVRVDMFITGRPYRAVTKICRQLSGAIVATIDIAAFGDPVEWIAHEFEHLIEQLDGINLRELERQKQGAWQTGNQMFETERAIRAGRRVMHEVRGAVAPPLNADAASVDSPSTKPGAGKPVLGEPLSRRR